MKWIYWMLALGIAVCASIADPVKFEDPRRDGPSLEPVREATDIPQAGGESEL